MASARNMLRVLVVEDEPLVAAVVGEYLQELGVTVVGPAFSLEQALKTVKSANFDVALVDINLAGRSAFPVVDVLIARNTPFAFTTGYEAEYLPKEYRRYFCLEKPYAHRDLAKILVALQKQVDFETRIHQPGDVSIVSAVAARLAGD
jgi:CheY-like chemotaxis protein